MTVSFDITPADATYRDQAIMRARDRNPSLDTVAAAVDLTMCHANGCPLDFAKLAGADEFELSHDVYGIANHLERDTGQLRGEFVPRCAL